MNGQHEEHSNFSELLPKLLQILIEILLLYVKIFYYLIQSFFNYFVAVQKSVEGDVVLITGGGHGIGKELAKLYAAEGATVVIWDINDENGNNTVAEIAKLRQKAAHYYNCDISQRENVLKVSQRVLKEVGDVTILINNAAVGKIQPLHDQSQLDIETTIKTNLIAQYWTLEAFVPTMKKNNYGHIVAISSLAGIKGMANMGPYSSTKFALRGLMESLEEELRDDNANNEIKLTLIYPYIVNTGVFNRVDIRFKSIMPVIEPEYVAREIMKAQRTDVSETSIPKYYYFFIEFGRLFPRPVMSLVSDFFKVRLPPQHTYN